MVEDMQLIFHTIYIIYSRLTAGTGFSRPIPSHPGVGRDGAGAGTDLRGMGRDRDQPLWDGMGPGLTSVGRDGTGTNLYGTGYPVPSWSTCRNQYSSSAFYV